MRIRATRWRALWIAGLGCVAAAAAVWHWQSEIIGAGAHWYLARVAAREETTGDLSRRRDAVSRMNRLLLLAPPVDALVPELFDLITGVSSRVATGEINFAWAAYVYTSYQRDLTAARPAGTPRRSLAEVAAEIERYVEFYRLQRRPDVPGIRLRDMVGGPAASYSVEEIERAAREGRRLE